MVRAKCKECGASRHPDEIQFNCRKCESFFELQIPSSFTLDELMKLVQEGRGIWNYRHFLPSIRPYVTYHEGNTPLMKPYRLFPDNLDVFFKDESRNPSGSFRDRCACLMACHAKMLSKSSVICGTSGNHGVSMVTYALPLGLSITCITPLMARLQRIAQIRALGGEIIAHGTNLSESIEKAKILSKKLNFYNATPENNYLTVQGQKTIAYEIAIQLKRYGSNVDAMTKIFVPLGAGLMFLSLYQGFKELLELRLIEEMPCLIGVGLESVENGEKRKSFFVPPDLIPLTGQSSLESEIIRALKETNGFMIEIDEETLLSQALLVARHEGIIIEPASASVIAGIQKYLVQNEFESRSKVIAVLTSSGNLYQRLDEISFPLRDFFSRRKHPFFSKFLILDYLARHGPSNGYRIWKHLSSLYPCHFQAVYQHLKALNQLGVIAPYKKMGSPFFTDSSSPKEKTFWFITDTGFEYLHALAIILKIELEKKNERRNAN